MVPEVALATTTWNCADIIEKFLTHYRRLGISRIHVVDYHSTDGTLEVLTSARWREFVELTMLPSLEGQDTSNELLATIKNGSAAWCLFCDPDEFLVTDTMSLRDVFADVDLGVERIVLPRFNMTTTRANASSEAFAADSMSLLTLRIQERVQRVPERRSTAPMIPPWIFTAIQSKVMVRVEHALEIMMGDHDAITVHPDHKATASGAILLHYPIRTYADFLAKVQLYRLDHQANPGRPGWHQARWIEILKHGMLQDEYLAQFVPDAELPGLLARGTVAVDERVRDFHGQELRGQAGVRG